MEEEKIKKINNLKSESAGRIMTSDVPAVPLDSTVGQIEKLLIEKVKEFNNINYVYVVDANNHLKGVLSVKELFRTPKDVPVKDFMVTNLVTVRLSTDRERVALLAIKHNLKNIPVIDKDGVFWGVVPSDTILDVLHQEGIEDALRSEGILNNRYSPKEFISAKAPYHFRKRLPWLLLGLLGGLLAALVVGLFENILSQMIILAAFIPAVVYMADAVGSQTQTIFVRSLAMDGKVSVMNYLRREISVGIWLACTLGVLSFLLALWWWQSFVVAVILGISFFFTITIAALSGIFLPWIFFKLKFDPAISSGPFATVVRDILSVLVYFGVAFIVLSIF